MLFALSCFDFLSGISYYCTCHFVYFVFCWFLVSTAIFSKPYLRYLYFKVICMERERGERGGWWGGTEEDRRRKKKEKKWINKNIIIYQERKILIRIKGEEIFIHKIMYFNRFSTLKIDFLCGFVNLYCLRLCLHLVLRFSRRRIYLYHRWSVQGNGCTMPLSITQ